MGSSFILEIKFYDRFPHWFRAILEEFKLDRKKTLRPSPDYQEGWQRRDLRDVFLIDGTPTPD